MKTVARRNLQVIKTGGMIDILQASNSPFQQVRLKPSGLAGGVKLLCVLVRKGLDHPNNITCHVTIVNRIMSPASGLGEQCDSRISEHPGNSSESVRRVLEDCPKINEKGAAEKLQALELFGSWERI